MNEFLEFDHQSDKGMVRSENQDRAGVWVPPALDEARQKGNLFVVCDGMGGHNGGSVASATTVDALLASYRDGNQQGVRSRLAASIDRANAAVRVKAGADITLRNMGTTCVAVAIRGRRAQIAHIGDSRAYLIRDGRAEQLTRDHTYLNDLIEIGLLTPEKARNHPERNIITRCIGMSDALQVDFLTREIKVGDVFLLCTDGLYNYVEPEELVQAVSTASAKDACVALVRFANLRGGEDNITCLIVKVTKVDVDAPPEANEETTPISAHPVVAAPTPGAGTTSQRAAFTPGTDLTLMREVTPVQATPLRKRWFPRGWLLLIVLESVILLILVVVKFLL